MRTKKLLFGAALALFISCGSFVSSAQSNEEPHIFVIQTWTRNTGPGIERSQADSLVRFYHENIVLKNEKLLSSRTMAHFFTSDSREYVFVLEYKSLTDMELAFKIDEANENKLWPTKKSREAYDMLWSKLFNHHCDEIYSEIPGTRK